MLDSIIAESKASEKLLKQINKAIVDLKPVLLQASPSTGKTFLTKLIHTHSQIKEGSFTEIDCAKLPQDED